VAGEHRSFSKKLGIITNKGNNSSILTSETLVVVGALLLGRATVDGGQVGRAGRVGRGVLAAVARQIETC